jgi:hypothetical protein
MLFNHKISLVTTCMKRADHLEQSLPTWLPHPIDEIIIVDWSSPDNVKEVIDKYQDGRIVHVSVPNRIIYDRSRSRNVGVRSSTGYFLVLCEIDIKIGVQSLSCVHSTQNILYRFVDKECSGLAGMCIITKSMFENINGYNERFEGWGREDYDLFERLTKNNYPEKRIIEGLKHIDHSDERRVMFHITKNTKQSEYSNKMLSKQYPWTNRDRQQRMFVSIVRPNTEIFQGWI